MNRPSSRFHFFRICWVIFLFLLLLGQLQRVQLTANIAFYLHELLIGFWLAAVFLGQKRRLGFINIIKTRINQNRWLGWFFLWGTVSLISHQLFSSFQLRPWLYLLRLSVYLGFALSLQLQLIRKQFSIKLKNKQVKLLPISLAAAGVLAAIFAWFQYGLMPDARHLARLGWDVHYFRLMGFYLDPNFTGLILTIAGLNLFRYLPTHPFVSLKRKTKTVFYIPPAAKLPIYGLLIAAVAFTYSRSSYLAFTASLAMIAIRFRVDQQRMKSGKLIIVGLLFLLSLPFLPKPGGEGVNLTRTSTIKSRVETNQTSLNQIRGGDWVWGQGLFAATISDEQNPDSPTPVHAHFPDNIIVFLTANTGLIGLLFFSLAIINWSAALYRQDYYQLIILWSVVGHSLFNLSLHEPFVLLWLLISLNFASQIKSKGIKLFNRGS